MTWLTWRQFRVSAVTALLGLAVAALLLGLTPAGRELASCAGQNGCPVVGDRFLGIGHDHLLKYLSTLLVGLPALVGAFWGAPLVARELETGTYRLLWNQSVTRTRWFLTKVTAVGLASAAVCGALSLMLGVWSSAAVNQDKLSPAMFAERGIVPVGYAVFAFALGVTVGVLIRRTVPAIIVTLVGFITARGLTEFLLRPHLLPVSHANFPIDGGLGLNIQQSSPQSSIISLAPPSNGVPGGWTVSSKIVDNAGHAPTQAFIQHACAHLPVPPPPGGPDRVHVDGQALRGMQQCTANVAAKFHEVVAYQPASHYWGLQWAETGVFLAMALALLGFSFWWIRRRIS
jgi:hypothetical protein